MVILFLLILWEAICTGLKVPEYLFPAPTAVWQAGLARWEPILMHATQTLLTTLAASSSPWWSACCWVSPSACHR